MRLFIILVFLICINGLRAQSDVNGYTTSDKAITVTFDDTLGASADTIIIDINARFVAAYHRFIAIGHAISASSPNVTVYMDEASCATCPWVQSSAWVVDNDNSLAVLDENGESIDAGDVNIMTHSVADNAEAGGFAPFAIGPFLRLRVVTVDELVHFQFWLSLIKQ